jgi:hypothetical protein
MVEWLPADRHLQAIHVREVRGTQPTGLMDLAEVHLPAWPLGDAPLLDPSLQSAQLPLVEPSRILGLQPIPQGLGLQGRRQLQLRGHFRPDLGERVHPRSPVAWLIAQFTR